MAGKTVPLTKNITIKGQAGVRISQPSEEWIDLTDFEELALLLDVAYLNAGTPSAINVIVETAQKPCQVDSEWKPVASLTATGSSLTYASAKAQATTHFLRFLRWRVSAGVTGSDWTATFKADVTLR